jgi:hypothetical protein
MLFIIVQLRHRNSVYTPYGVVQSDLIEAPLEIVVLKVVSLVGSSVVVAKSKEVLREVMFTTKMSSKILNEPLAGLVSSIEFYPFVNYDLFTVTDDILKVMPLGFQSLHSCWCVSKSMYNVAKCLSTELKIYFD